MEYQITNYNNSGQQKKKKISLGSLPGLLNGRSSGASDRRSAIASDKLSWTLVSAARLKILQQI